MTTKSKNTSRSISPSSSPQAFDRRGVLDFLEAPVAGLRGSVDHGEDDAPKGYAEYEERYIAFVDILGFKELILESAKANPKVKPSTIYNALDIHPTAIQDFFASLADMNRSESDSTDLRVHTFSDFVVASTHKNEFGLCLLLFLCWHIASDWLSKSFLCRGGITIGKVLHRISDGNAPLVFGPAFVQAYTLESEIADFPRIVLSKEVRQHYRAIVGSNSPMPPAVRNVAKMLIQKCDDGPWSIDTFCHLRKNGLSGLGNEHDTEARQFHEALKGHLDDATDTPHFYRKVRWLVDRFNGAIDKSRYAGNSIEP